MKRLQDSRLFYALLAAVVGITAGAALAGFSIGQRRSCRKSGSSRLLGGL